MGLLKDAFSHKRMDTRVVEKNISRGIIRAEDFEKELQSLPDDGENAEWVSIDELKAEPVSAADSHRGHGGNSHMAGANGHSGLSEDFSDSDDDLDSGY